MTVKPIAAWYTAKTALSRRLAGRQCMVWPALLTLSVSPALADPLFVENTTVITGSDGQIYSAIGSDMETSGVSIAGSRQGGSYSLSLTYETTFSGTAVSGEVTAHYADIFLRLPSSGFSASPFGLAISLGDQAANGGVAAGLYSPASIATSADIWGSRTSYVYAAGYGAAAGAPVFAAPTVLTGGALVAGSAVAIAQTDTGLQRQGQDVYKLHVTVSGLSFALAEALNGGFDVFWGTADCGNGAFLADPGVGFFRLPAPGPIGPLALGAGVVFWARRRKPV